MKNFKFKSKVIVGQEVRILESLSGENIECVEEFARALFSNNAPFNTVETYLPCVCKYLDFVVEAMSLLNSERWGEISKFSIVDLYFQALSLGSESEELIVRALVENLGWKILAPGSIKISRQALFLFFQLSEKYAHHDSDGVGINEVRWQEVGNVIKSDVPRALDFEYKTKGWHSRKVDSYLAECIAGGVGVKILNSLPQYFLGAKSRNLDELALNISEVKRLIESIKNPRDYVYYSLLAAGGARVSETLQVLLSDIDIKRRIVRVVNPRDRKKLYMDMGLSMSQINSLSFKGRTNQRLTLIEPFATMFWEGLGKLLVSPYLPAIDGNGFYLTHDFLFCVTRGPTRGMPLCLVDQSPILRTFKKNLKRIGVDVGCQHDVRHMYVSFLCNDIPSTTGKGLGVETTSKLVGHINIASTEVYNHLDSSEVLAAAEDFYTEHGYYSNALAGE